jgi:transposase
MRNSQVELDGMPEPEVATLRLIASEGRVVVTCGRSLLYLYDADDKGMRNLAIVALTDAGRPVNEVARVFGLTATYVSIMRGKVRKGGSAALVTTMGRPRKLSARQVAQAQEWAGAGWTQRAIADKFGVSHTMIGEVLARVGPAPVQDALLAPPASLEPEVADVEPAVADAESAVADAESAVVPMVVGVEPDVEPTVADAEPAVEPAVAGAEPAGTKPAHPDAELVVPVQVGDAFAGSARIATGTRSCRYAGAMLLYPYLDMVGTEAIFASLTGGPARRYDDLSILTTATLAFALGIPAVEGTKHLRRADTGAATGMDVAPQLATLRARLGALADGSDPLALQRAFATGMLTADPARDPVYFVDDHFVAYAGARPVAKGWNTKRRHAQPGRDDTVVVDARGRAVIFSSGEPTSLSANLPGVLTQLRTVLGPDAPILLAFDRGGAYPSAFTACRDAGAHWVTYRRAPLTAPATEPRECEVMRGAATVTVMLADEIVDINGYGPARQLTLFEHGEVVLQVLTSDLTATGAELLYWLRARWRVENTFKYASAHNGIDTLADYSMDIAPDHRQVTNPARTTARNAVTSAEADLATAERALPQLLAGASTPAQMNTALPGLHRQIETATRALADAKTALRPIPAKIPATTLDPDAKLARPRLERRGLQMVLRLLAFNAEAWLAEHLNAYLVDPDEYRALTRHLLHAGGHIDYTTRAITITLDRPDSPRIARALALLTEELNALTASLPGDNRPLTYQLTTP